MYDELIAELRQYNNDGTEELRRQAADAIEELEKQLDEETEYATALNSYVPQWIPCSERLPEKDTEVLTFLWGDHIEIGYVGNAWKCEGLSWDFEEFALEGEDFDEVTHWMPLPKPPDHIREASKMVEESEP